MPRWLLHGFLAASVALFALAWLALFAQQGTIAGLRQDIALVDARLGRMNALVNPNAR